jgi:hypothetical protein
MPERAIHCVQSCKEVCTALETAARHERSAILDYGTLRDACTYPDIKVMLNELIIQKKKSIELVERTKELLRTRFDTLDRIREGFEME